MGYKIASVDNINIQGLTKFNCFFNESKAIYNIADRGLISSLWTNPVDCKTKHRLFCFGSFKFCANNCNLMSFGQMLSKKKCSGFDTAGKSQIFPGWEKFRN